MSADLTARLLVEIDRRYDVTPWVGARAYLADLRAIAELHAVDDSDECHPLCVLCGWADGDWPCLTVRMVCEAVGVEP